MTKAQLKKIRDLEHMVELAERLEQLVRKAFTLEGNDDE
jgi:hypothetical protein